MGKLGLLGFGEAGYHIGKGLVLEGLEGLMVYDVGLQFQTGYKQLILERIKDAGVTCASSVEELVKENDIVMGLIPSQFVEDAGMSVLPHAGPDTVYVDASSSSPLLKEKMAEIFAQKGISYVDSAIMAAVPGDGHKVPMSCSGKGSETFAKAMEPYRMRITVLEGNPGLASKIKLTRSIFMKGFEAWSI